MMLDRLKDIGFNIDIDINKVTDWLREKHRIHIYTIYKANYEDERNYDDDYHRDSFISYIRLMDLNNVIKVGKASTNEEAIWLAIDEAIKYII